MICIRKFWWTGVALATFVGCAEEQPPAPSAPATPAAPTTPPAAAKPATPESAKPEATEAAPTKEMEKTETPAPAALPKIEGPKIEAPKPEAEKKADAAKLSDEELANIKKLPAAEQPLALKQLVCPVSDEHLGAMDTPVKITAGGKTFFVCCKGCKKDVDADLKAVLAKLKN